MKAEQTSKAKPHQQKEHCEPVEAGISPSIHRRILTFLNNAIRPEDLAFEKNALTHDEGNPIHEDNPEELHGKRKKLLDLGIAKEILEFRDKEFPFGFRSLRDLVELRQFDFSRIEVLFSHLSPATFGQWRTLPYPITTQNPGGGAEFPIEVVHAALLHTGKVVFIPADFGNARWKTPIWDPNDEATPRFEYPLIDPDYSLLCSGHCFLSNGHLLAVGGGGDLNVTPTAWWGFKLDPVARTWTRTAGRMDEYKWYPTAVVLHDKRVLVTCGNTIGEMEIYNEDTDMFEPVTGDSLRFPNLYPGLHVLPNGATFYSRTGWGSATNGSPRSNDNSAYFTFAASPANTGAWTGITPSTVNRCKGMSVMILQNSFPSTRILVVGGSDASGNGVNSAEVIDLSILSAASAWTSTGVLPDTLPRRQCNAVLLPDSTVFVAGGVLSNNSPCMLYNPTTNAWTAMDELPSVRAYHSVMLLLPSGKVMMAGGTAEAGGMPGSPNIEVFSPPYLFRGARPVISSAPALVHHGQNFVIESPDASTIVKVVLVRPMAVTHQTDAEQRVLEMPYIHDHANPTRLTLTAPHGGHPHAIAPMGYYMMFAINNNGVPSVASWVYLH